MLEGVRDLCSRYFSGYEPIPEEIGCLDRAYIVGTRILGHPVLIATAAAGGIAWLTFSIVDYTSVIGDYTEACIDDLNDRYYFPTQCEEPYEERIERDSYFINFSCVLLGFIIQRLWEERGERGVSEEQQSLLDTVQRDEVTTWQQFQLFVRHLQSHYSYDLQLFLAYLNNGLLLESTSPASWEHYFVCQRVAQALFALGIGMYARALLVYIEQQCQREMRAIPQLPSDQEAEGCCRRFLQRHWQPLVFAGAGVGAIGATFLTPDWENLPIKPFIFLFPARAAACLFSRWIGRVHDRAESLRHRKIIVITRALLSALEVPLVIVASYFFTPFAIDEYMTFGAVCIGIAQGLHDGNCTDAAVISFPSSERELARQERVWNAVKEHWPAVAMIAALIAESQTDFLACRGAKDFNCVLSLQFEHNYLRVDGEGLQIAVATGLSVYYARKVARWMQTHRYRWRAPELFLYTLNRLQFDMLSLLVYSVIFSGLEEEGLVNSAYNPKISLILLGWTMANYKERSSAIAKALEAAKRS